MERKTKAVFLSLCLFVVGTTSAMNDAKTETMSTLLVSYELLGHFKASNDILAI